MVTLLTTYYDDEAIVGVQIGGFVAVIVETVVVTKGKRFEATPAVTSL